MIVLVSVGPPKVFRALKDNWKLACDEVSLRNPSARITDNFVRNRSTSSRLCNVSFEMRPATLRRKGYGSAIRTIFGPSWRM